MSHVFTQTEEIEEYGQGGQRPAFEEGQKYLCDVSGERRLRIVRRVEFLRYVYEDVALWEIEIEQFMENEYVLSTMSGAPVFIVNGLVGVLTQDVLSVQGEFTVATMAGNIPVHGVAPFGFYGCRHLTKVIFEPKVVIAYPYAFAYSGLTEMVFNDEIPVILHISSIDHCNAMPKFNLLFDRPFPGKYLFCGGEMFDKWEYDFCNKHF